MEVNLTLQILRGSEREPVGDPVGLEVPLGRGFEALRWNYLCAENEDLDPERMVIAPIWREEARPLVKALEFATVDRCHRIEVDLRKFFARKARHISSRLIQQRLLEEGDVYDYAIAAHQRDDRSKVTIDPLRYTVRDCDSRPPACEQMDREFYDDGDFDVFFERQVIKDAIQLARDAGDEEAGSTLLGHLLRQKNSDDSRPFLQVTALVPARDGQRGETSFEFNAECYNHARSVLEQRGRQEMMVSWMHSHPDFCRPTCPEESRARCALRKPFLSDSDLIVQELNFPSPFHVALLVSDDGKRLTPSLFGWRNGVMTRRAFAITSTSKP